MLRKEGFRGFLLGSLGFRRAAFLRDMRLSISRWGVPPYLPLLSFPLYATFVSVSLSFNLSFGMPWQGTSVSLPLSLSLSLSLSVFRYKKYQPIAKPLSS